MAVIKAQANGNWSSTGTWSGGVVPSLQDTVYANGFSVTINQNIDLTGSTVDQSGSFIPGQLYQVVSIGTTNFGLVANCIIPGTNAGTPTAISSAVGQIFQAVNAGTATTGTARRLGALLNHVNTPLTIATGGGFAISSNYNVTGAYILAGSANCLTISGTANSTLTNCYSVGSPFTLSTRGILFSSSGTLTCSNMVVAGGRISGTAAANGTHGIESTSTGTLAFSNASLINGGVGAFCYGILTSSSPQLTFNGSCTATGGSGATSSWAIVTGGTITYNGGSIIGGSIGAITSTGNTNISNAIITAQAGVGVNSNGAAGHLIINDSVITGGSSDYGVSHSSTGNVTISGGSITGGSGLLSYGFYSVGTTGNVSIISDIIASNTSQGVYITTATMNVNICGNQTSSQNGTQAVVCFKYLVNPTPTATRLRYAKNGVGTYTDFYTADNVLGQADPADVRFGTTYADGALVGALRVPSPSLVAFGVPTDDTSGTAVLSFDDIRASLGVASANLDAQLSGIAGAVWSNASRTITGGTISSISGVDSSRLAQVATTEIVSTLISQSLQ